MDLQRQKTIKNVIAVYKKTEPQKYAGAVEHAKKVRKSKANIYGSDIKGEFRHEFSLPADLYEKIDSLLPTSFLGSSEENAWFRRNFPEFAGQEKW
jgi:hypothetical protein